MAGMDVGELLRKVTFPTEFPFGPEQFKRMDESSDGEFYAQPRFVFHIDEFAVKALTNYYAGVMPQHGDVLDLCSSWVSHYPEGFKGKRVVGLGMNKAELEKNPQLTEYVLQDLNVDAKLPFGDASFDFVTCVVSVDYLNKVHPARPPPAPPPGPAPPRPGAAPFPPPHPPPPPPKSLSRCLSSPILLSPPLEVFREIARVLRPGGSAHMSFSNRCFPSKAIKIWLETSDADHVLIVASYFHYAGGFLPAEALDISPNPGITDPMFVVRATKK
eukprot:tig00021346_g20375.t1